MNQSAQIITADLFRTLGHPLRVRIVELLRDGERSVGELQGLVGSAGGASQHLAVLRRQGLLESRRDGTSVLYRVKDPRAFQLLDVAREVLGGQLETAQSLLVALSASPVLTGSNAERRA